MLHAPLARWRPNDDLFAELVKEKKRGSVRFIGVSGNEIDGVVAEFGSLLEVSQTRSRSGRKIASFPT